MAKKSSIIKDALALFLITLVAGLALGFVYEVTAPVIQERKDAAKREAYAAVFADANFVESDAIKTALEDENFLANSGTEGITINEAFVAQDSSGNDAGFVLSVTTSKGFGGPITMSIGVDNDGNVTGMEMLTIAETPGFGMKATEEEFQQQYINRGAETFEVVKENAGDGQINAISGATITSNAVTNAVNAALYFARTVGGK